MANQLTLIAYEEIKPEAKNRKRIMDKMEKLSAQLIATLKTESFTLHSPEDAAKLIVTEMSCLEREQLRILTLNTRNRLINLHLIYQGSLNSSQVRIGELFKPAILENAASIIIAHNHPSGDPMPSPDDVTVTRAIVEAGKLLDIDVLDHLVIAGGSFVSLKQRGLGFDISETRARYTAEVSPMIQEDTERLEEFNALDQIQISIYEFSSSNPKSPLIIKLAIFSAEIDREIDRLFDDAVFQALD